MLTTLFQLTTTYIFALLLKDMINLVEFVEKSELSMHLNCSYLCSIYLLFCVTLSDRNTMQYVQDVCKNCTIEPNLKGFNVLWQWATD